MKIYNKINSKPIKILHVLNSLGFGGAENWLKHMLSQVDRRKYQIDVMINEEKEGHAEEIKKLGGNIIRCSFSKNIWKYGNNFKKILKYNGPYSIVHSHLASMGFHLFWAYEMGIPVRIGHNHTNDVIELHYSNFIRKFGVWLSKFLVKRYATAGIAVSRSAINFFGTNWKSDPRWKILYLGINLDQFQKKINKEKVLYDFGIPESSMVIGHVGRFTFEKNHDFLLDIFAELMKMEPNAWLLLIGDGFLRTEIEIKAKNLNIADKVIFAGNRGDVPQIMQDAMDIFVMPSRYEGLPLTLMETQAAGLPSVISDIITDEADIIKSLITRISLKESAEFWAKEILNIVRKPKKISKEECLKIMKESPFNIQNSCKSLFKLYNMLLSNKKI